MAQDEIDSQMEIEDNTEESLKNQIDTLKKALALKDGVLQNLTIQTKKTEVKNQEVKQRQETVQAHLGNMAPLFKYLLHKEGVMVNDEVDKDKMETLKKKALAASKALKVKEQQ